MSEPQRILGGNSSQGRESSIVRWKIHHTSSGRLSSSGELSLVRILGGEYLNYKMKATGKGKRKTPNDKAAMNENKQMLTKANRSRSKERVAV
ncbi:hypothetical protein DEO72_LG11g1944 [Vigna unguiculata]|uniref:Uncharacterized protein n=1 Tax=Vigna unguiculata TaxID=3917 RepID=A0A4D6NNM1_VIGUN|nr:hypothetical protein DEO72_LG11g1944 [Vigna unguiculata]